MNPLEKIYHQSIEVKALDFYLWNEETDARLMWFPSSPAQFTPSITRISSGYIPKSYLLLGIQIHKDSSSKVSLWCIDIREGLGIQVNSLQASIYFSTGVLFRSTCFRWCQINYRYLIYTQSYRRALESYIADIGDLADACGLRFYSSFGEVLKLLKFLKENALED